ncbi:MAG: methyl-accepting chemotaxis protein [Burkholderiales bacterium]|nr:MAG: methyl-accepting chemotaxis protein [Burkholderiales bacterium]
MKMKQVLLGLGVLSALLSAAVGGTGWWGLNTLGRDMDESVMATHATQTATMGDMMHDALRGDVFQALMYVQMGDAAGMAQAQKDAKTHGDNFVARVHELQGMPLAADLKQKVDALAPVIERYAAAGQALTEQALHDGQGAQAQLPAFLALFKQLETEQDVVIEGIEAAAKATRAEAQQARTQSLLILAIVMVLGGALLLIAIGTVTRHIMQTLGAEPDTVRKLLRRVKDGELGVDVRVEPRDNSSVMASLAEMVQQLRATVLNVRDNADSVANASSEVSAGSSDLSNRTQDQAAALERSASALEQLSSTVSHNADNAAQATQLAQGASDVAAHGGEMVDRLVGTMQDIHQSSQKIAEIISVIDGIAFQTNILALNAAVEAARAGEQGRGFAVVAGEVRSLAQRSAGAAREIKSLISSSVERATVGAQQADQTGATMKNIVEAIARVTDVIAEISSASKEQTTGIAQVTEAVVQMDQGTQSNAALVEQTAAAAESLRNQADHLARAVAAFQLDTNR